MAEALQQEILEYAERYLKKLKANEALHSILELKPPVETPKYATRFKHEVWANALRLVRKITDKPGSPPLRPQWRLDSPAQHVCENPMATMVQAFCDEILKLTDYPRPPSRDEIHVLQRTIQKTLSELFGITFDANGTEERRKAPSNFAQNTQTTPNIAEMDKNLFLSDFEDPPPKTPYTRPTEDRSEISDRAYPPGGAGASARAQRRPPNTPDANVQNQAPPSAQKPKDANAPKNSAKGSAPSWAHTKYIGPARTAKGKGQARV